MTGGSGGGGGRGRPHTGPESTTRRILAELDAREPLTVRDLVDAVGRNEQTVRHRLLALEARGLVRRWTTRGHARPGEYPGGRRPYLWGRSGARSAGGAS